MLASVITYDTERVLVRHPRDTCMLQSRAGQGVLGERWWPHWSQERDGATQKLLLSHWQGRDRRWRAGVEVLGTLLLGQPCDGSLEPEGWVLGF